MTGLSTTFLHGQTLQYWHDWLSRDNGIVPCSRYGRDSRECAWWAIACEAIYVDTTGDDAKDPDAAADSLDYLMGLVVNDGDGIVDFVREYWEAIPGCVASMLDRSVLEP